LRLFSFGGYGLALAALVLVVFGAYDSYPSISKVRLDELDRRICVGNRWEQLGGCWTVLTRTHCLARRVRREHEPAQWERRARPFEHKNPAGRRFVKCVFYYPYIIALSSIFVSLIG